MDELVTLLKKLNETDSQFIRKLYIIVHRYLERQDRIYERKAVRAKNGA